MGSISLGTVRRKLGLRWGWGPLWWGLAGWAAISLAGCATSGHADAPAPSTGAPLVLRRFEYEEPKLGTLFRILVYAEEATQADRAAAAAFLRIDELDRVFSDYRPDSELSQLNRAARDGPITVPVSEELFRLLQECQRIARASDGAFDVTVGPYVRLWRRARRQGEFPNKEALIHAALRVGHEKLTLDDSTRSVSFAAAGMSLDLGAIAKGFILDEAMEVLQEHGIERALIDGGGDLLASGPPPGLPGWRVAIQHQGKDESPTAAPDQAHTTLAHAALATSGDTYQFFEHEGVRYSHIVDPSTGLGLTNRYSVTVRTTTATIADAMASAFCVLGPEKYEEYLDVVDDQGYSCVLVAPM